MTPFALTGLATALPEYLMTQEQAAELARTVTAADPRQQRLLDVLYRRSGVAQRHTALPHQIALEWLEPDGESFAGTQGPSTAQRMQWYEQLAPALAASAARGALEQAAVTASKITHLVTVSCTGFVAPGIDLALIQQLMLPPTVQRVHVGFMGCHGAINGLRVAQGLLQQADARVLLCAVELCSLHYRFQWDPERFLGNALFADGAAAVVGQAAATSSEWHLVATGSCFIPDSAELMSWRIGDFGFEMTLSAEVPDKILQSLRPWLCEWLGQYDVRLEEVGCWAIHPGGPRILTAVEDALELPPRATQVSREVLQRCGNMSSPTVLFILDELRAAGARSPCVMLGFGPGLVAEAALLRR